MADALTHPADLRKDAPTFNNVLTLVGCSRAIVRVAWIYNRDTKESHHAFSRVDLVPDEVPRVDAGDDGDQRLGGDSKWRVYFESWEVPSSSAGNWYESMVFGGQWAPPWRESALTNPVAVSDCLDEPRWPSLVMQRESRGVPSASRGEAESRAHHLLVAHPLIPDLLSESELRKLSDSLEQQFDIDVDAIPELVQSSHFFQPVPILRHVSSRLERADDGPDKAVALDIVPRKGMALQKLTLEVLEHRPTGVRLLCRMRPEVPFYRLALAEDVV